ncbi:sedoheptulose 7-phosphate cyclase [Polynucleobacter sp. Adler-ghost]|uniref:sedoheptulose 7-phosphate cyclase n=1 Tax=Polynucleobacter sp. Adler-ghost TaxID=2770234 RepID=UPI001BFE52E5|nr:sedoheptulose 7-phosphate cyclase [Polynucleobacter sp. Adler-ghost]QWE31046.1 sedoheptulose 7-phosphate cyclase [Polynucleobacter sp. Adler-ghost]
MLNTQDKDCWNISSSQDINFSIIASRQYLFDPLNIALSSSIKSSANNRRLIVVDRNICEFYLEDIKNYFDYHDVEHHMLAIDATEDDKNIESLLTILTSMEDFGLLRRSEPVIAIGGGVLLDLVGFAASIYRRGVPYIRIPTTLVGLVDASVGIKTGINIFTRRNRLGTYFPPICSYLDKGFLKTLPKLEIRSGMGEILKMAVIKDAKLFEILENYGGILVEDFVNCVKADEVIQRSINGMVAELESNLWELDLKRKVDFGHSFSPIIEMRSLEDSAVDSLTHGQAVALDVIFSSVLALNRGFIQSRDMERILMVAKDIGLPIIHPYFKRPLLIFEALSDTTKHRNGSQNLPLPFSIGDCCFINDVTLSEIEKGVDTLIAITGQIK